MLTLQPGAHWRNPWTPVQWKIYHCLHHVDALDLAGPSCLETTSGDIWNPDSDDKDSDWENGRPTRPLPAHSCRGESTTPAPLRQLSRPRRKAKPTQLDNPPAPQVNNPNVQLAPPPPAPFVLPSARTLADVIAAAHSQNPHLQLQPAQAALPINPKLNLMLFQQNVGTFPSHIITNAQLMRDITPTQLANFEESPTTIAYETPLDAQVETVLHTLSPYGALKVRLPLADPNSARINKYGGPSSIMVEVGNNAGAAAIRAQTTFGVAHAGCIITAYNDPAIFRLVDKLTQSEGGDPMHRVFIALNSMHFQLLQHTDKPVLVGYLEPLTANEVEQEQLHSLLRGAHHRRGIHRAPHGHRRLGRN
ncbi:hypothetical protein B0H10DRAFT_2216040 [Mycena sp. CBHHK59/15]|nr:hypothetical protein B0H10DRAFT_2216040 [Mycena sp. CBHHK59/15]